jgi:hypothetical protein
MLTLSDLTGYENNPVRVGSAAGHAEVAATGKNASYSPMVGVLQSPMLESHGGQLGALLTAMRE